jgi:hypothetical protein
MAGQQIYTDKQIASALKRARGMVYVAARHLKCSPNTIKARLETSEELREVREEARGLIVDTGELKLVDAVEAGEAWAVKYLLATQGKDRGYVEKQEVDNSGELTVRIIRERRG